MEYIKDYMAKEVNIEYKDINLTEALAKLALERDKILEEFTKAYLAETGLKPSEIELVCKQDKLGMTIENVYFFRKKE